jgi:septum formation protein
VTQPRLVLASGSPARRRLLEQAGIDFEVIVSGVSEEGYDHLAPLEVVAELAEAKAVAVAATLDREAVVLAADSMFELDGELFGKPLTAAVAVERWQAMRSRRGLLHTGHFLLDTATGRRARGTATTAVVFADASDAEIAAYVASGEPLEVAGAFTLDGRAAPFVERVEGDPSNVLGLSMPLLRTLLGRLGIGIVDLWA